MRGNSGCNWCGSTKISKVWVRSSDGSMVDRPRDESSSLLMGWEYLLFRRVAPFQLPAYHSLYQSNSYLQRTASRTLFPSNKQFSSSRIVVTSTGVSNRSTFPHVHRKPYSRPPMHKHISLLTSNLYYTASLLFFHIPPATACPTAPAISPNTTPLRTVSPIFSAQCPASLSFLFHFSFWSRLNASHLTPP